MMKADECKGSIGLICFALAITLALPSKVFAHCDAMDGPVVQAAQKALETENVNPVLIWVASNDEAEIRKTFQQTLEVRKLSPEARAFADKYFFETLVRIHRAGEGAPYTGLKPAGIEPGPAIQAADEALKTGAIASLKALLMEAMLHGLEERFEEAMLNQKFDQDDVDAGREYVESYVTFIHYAERLYDAASQPAQGHIGEFSHR